MKRHSGILGACAGVLLGAAMPVAAADPPVSPLGLESLEHFTLGAFFEARDLLREALQEYRLAERDAPDDPEVQGSLARVLWQLGETDDARSHAEAALRLDAKHADALEVMVGIHRGERNLTAAIAKQRRLVEVRPTEVDARAGLGELLEMNGELEAAAEVYAEATRIRPGLAQIHFRRANVLARLGRSDDALAEFDTVRQLEPRFVDVLLSSGSVRESNRDLEGAEADYRGALAIDPQHLHARRRLLRVLLLRDEAEAAEVEARRILELTPDDLDVREQLGVLLLRAGRADEAVVELRAVEQAAPDRLSIRRHLGRVFWDRRDAVEAEKQYEAAVRIDPTFTEGWVNLGYLRAESGRREEAIEAFEKACNQSPDNPVLHFLRGVSYNQAERWDPAAAAFTRSLELRPKNPEALQGLGTARERQGQIDAAAAAFRQLLEISPNDPEALNYLGYMLADAGRDLPEAKRLLEKAVGLEPDNGFFLDSLGWAHFKSGDLEQARQYLERAVALVASDAVILEHYGDVLAAVGERGRAAEIFRRVLELSPEAPGVKAKWEAAASPE